MIARPENWRVQFSEPFAFSLPLEGDGTRTMKSGIRFHGAEIALAVPAHWENQRAYACMNELIAALNQRRR